jgi:hypothetical protein
VIATVLLSLDEAHGATYDESIAGDLSGQGSAPTTLALDAGENLLLARSGAGDFDILHLALPAGGMLESVVLESYSGFRRSFTGIQQGQTWTAGLGFSVNAASLLGWTHFGAAAGSAGVGNDILDNMGNGSGAIGFTPPLPAGDYTLLFQDTDSAVNFSMTLVVSTESLPGDFNNDRLIDAADLTQWQNSFGLNANADANADGDSDGADFLIWQRNVTGAPAASSVPEPSTLVLALAACWIVASGRRSFPELLME